jgi:Heavy-metal-associated domain.
MTVLRTDDIHCEKCVERITKALTRSGFDFQVNLQKKTVSLKAEGVKLMKAKEILEDLGFEMEEV